MMKNNILRKIIRIISLVLEPIVIIAISSIIVFALVLKVNSIKEGANMNKKKYTIEEKKEKILEYMKERYGEEFVGLRWSGKDFFQSYDKFVVYPKNKTPKDEVRVAWIYDEEKKDYDIYDSYMGILIKDKYTDYVTKLVRTKYPTAYVTVRIDSDKVYKNSFTLDIPVNKILDEGDPYFCPYIQIAVPEKIIYKNDVFMYYKNISDLFFKERLSAKLGLSICKDSKFEEYVSKKGEIYPDGNYSKDIEGEYFIHEKGMSPLYYEYTIRIYKDSETNEFKNTFHKEFKNFVEKGDFNE